LKIFFWRKLLFHNVLRKTAKKLQKTDDFLKEIRPISAKPDEKCGFSSRNTSVKRVIQGASPGKRRSFWAAVPVRPAAQSQSRNPSRTGTPPFSNAKTASRTPEPAKPFWKTFPGRRG
jgi:hypothetical protein